MFPTHPSDLDIHTDLQLQRQETRENREKWPKRLKLKLPSTSNTDVHVYVCCDVGLQSDNGMEMMTPFPVPTHSRLQETIRAVILTKEKPSFPVPVKDKWKSDYCVFILKPIIKELKSLFFRCTLPFKSFGSDRLFFF